jgi:hypothetical protein
MAKVIIGKLEPVIDKLSMTILLISLCEKHRVETRVHEEWRRADHASSSSCLA